MKNGLKKTIALLGAVGAVGAMNLSQAQESPQLPAMGANMSQVSVSGLSSGAFMTAQLGSAYSATFMGVGVMAGGPFMCSKSYGFNANMTNAMNACMNPLTDAGAPDGKKLFAEAAKLAQTGKIDPVENLKKQRVMVFSGGKDKTVRPVVVKQVEAYYVAAGLESGKTVKYQEIADAGHAITVTDRDATACSITETPYVNNCGINESTAILEQIYGNLKPAATALSGTMLRFNQKEFIKGTRSSMSDDAFAYVPKSCETESCRVHVAIHGCRQGYKVIGKTYYTQTGYNEVADTNNIIVLYPQAEPKDSAPFNPKGCWDFWGYTETDSQNKTFFTKDAPQMKAIMEMVSRLGQPRSK